MSHLKQKVDHHPEVTRYAMESMELKSERQGWEGGWAGLGRRVGGAGKEDGRGCDEGYVSASH